MLAQNERYNMKKIRKFKPSSNNYDNFSSNIDSVRIKK